MTLVETRNLCLDVPDMGHRVLLGRRRTLSILRNINLAIDRGETLGIVGESGSGKTSLGRTLLRLYQPSTGELRFDGADITRANQVQMKPLRRRMQIIFQDPQSSLNPRRTIAAILATPLRLHGLDSGSAAIAGLLDRVGLPSSVMHRYPHQISGGQRQRVGIARAISVNPEFIVADEIVSGLDASTQAQVLDLLRGLKDQFKLTLAFISHDLSVIRHLCERVVIMRGGEIIEEGATADVFRAPKSEFTRALISAIPLPSPDPQWLWRD